MFPIPWNFPFRKKNGDMSTIGAEIGGASSELPPHSAGDAGKLLGVKANGSLEWSDTVNSEIQTLTNQADDIVNVLSAKNLWSETIPPTANSGGSYTLANHEYVVSTTASTNSGVYWSTDKLSPFYADMVGVSAKLSFEVKADAPMRAYVGFYNNEVSLTTNYQKIEQDFADLSQIASAFKVYTLDTTSAHTIFMKNVMIRPANITSDVFVPYAKTNRELTEDISDLSVYEDGIITAQNDFTLSPDRYFWYNKITKIGQIHLNFTVPSSVTTSEWHTIGTLNKSLLKNATFTAMTLENPPIVRDFLISGSNVYAFVGAADVGKSFRIGQMMVLVNA